METKQTIGQQVDKEVSEAFEIYNYFKKCDDAKLRSLAVTLARHDALVNSIVSRMVMERLEKELPMIEA